ncbi:MAG: 2-dehydropantoate 2-reductase [Xanthobacteraceae bacterium]|nr:2-dehydropantoate 2-reductase [Xanthobacteraceae bacterium]QYK45444.1 MAG: 2-dehydropantoate 2-reductase [Xanthobacteraceae bacterium]
MNEKPRIAVVGAGAIGSLLAAIWVRAEEDVTLVVREERVAGLRASGITASGLGGDFHVTPKIASAIPHGTEFAVFTMKTQDLAEALRASKAALGNATVVTTQNGVRAREIVQAELGVEPITATLMLNASMLEPGAVRYNRIGTTVLGAVPKERRRELAEMDVLFELVSPVFDTEQIEGAMWSKLVINALTNSLQALTGKSLNECVNDPAIATFAVAQLKESFGVVRAARIPLIDMPGAPMKLFSTMMRLPGFIAKAILRKNLGRADEANTLTSTLQSILRKQPTEIDYLNGEFVRLGEKINFPTPVNRAIVEAVRNIEKTGVFLSRDEIAGMVRK